MLLKKIKEILQKEGGKCIIIDENKSSYLVIELKSYSNQEKISGKLVKTKPIGQTQKDIDDAERANRDIAELKASEDKEEDLNDLEEEQEEVKIEDLPF